MASKNVIQWVDDLDGKNIARGSTVKFGLDGRTFEIDLSAANQATLRSALAPFMAAGRKVPRSALNSRP